jgi:uncharacterized repeat protein (TIGR03803 family)
LVLLFGGSACPAQTNYQRLLSFGVYSDWGKLPYGQLMEASDGLLYGTTYAGGASNLGTVFRIAKDGSGFSVLRSFSDPNFLYGGVVEGTNGVLYGTAAGGGSHSGGAVFAINKDGSGFLVVHNFDPGSADGAAPVNGLIRAKDGMLYGTCSKGGNTNLGTVFRISADGTVYGVIHNFLGQTNGGDGSSPGASLTQGLDGDIYGTTQAGGNNNMGTLFKLNTDGSVFSILHHFSGSSNDGRVPLGNLAQGPDGLLYGTTEYGGVNSVGTLFQVDTNGNNYAVLMSFSTSSGGYEPLGGLTFGSDGALYGTTRYGGPNDSGVAFRLSTTDTNYVVLHQFLGVAGDGAQPFAPLLQASDGAWYGSTYYGGDRSVGVLFRLFSGNAPVTITAITSTPTDVTLNFAGGAASQAYGIQASPSLSSAIWQTIGTNTAAIDGSFQFTELGGAGLPTRYYRSAVVQ